MASSTKIDVDNFDDIDTQDEGGDLLKFQDIPHGKDDGQTHQFTDFPHTAADSDEDEDDRAKLLKEKSTHSFWTFAYYQQFFDVDTKQVGQRILGSMVPRPGQNYLLKNIRPNPDLYGPFWICTTLVFTTAIAGNLANYFSAAGKFYKWKYDFHKVTFAATAIFSYWWLIPLILFGILWWRGSQAKFSFLEMLCVYGYSLAIYIPISVLWAIQVSWLQWTLVVLGALLSGSVLLLTFWPAVSEDNKKIAIGLMVFILVMHAALATGFVLYFFYVPSAQSDIPVTSNTTVIPTPVTMNSSRVVPAHVKLHNFQPNKEPIPQVINKTSDELTPKSENRGNIASDVKRESKLVEREESPKINNTVSSPGRGINTTADESWGHEKLRKQ